MVGHHGEGYFFFYVGGRIIFGLDHHHIRRSQFLIMICISPFKFLLLSDSWDGYVYLGYAEPECNI
jgi:hypothetical protein